MNWCVDHHRDCLCSVAGDQESFHSAYTLGKQLGKGAQGRVHACACKRSGAVCAVKMIDRTSKTSWTTFTREIELCKAVSSFHVIGVLEEFVDTSCCYIVMERFEGHLRKGLKWVAREAANDGVTGINDATLQGIARQVLAGIFHLHCAGIVHRDVKSHNVFIDRLDVRDRRCRLVLGDLGLARRLEPGKFLCAQVGTRKYWAPELYDKRYSHVVDVFALGVLLFLAMSATYPYLDEEQTRRRDVFADGGVLSSNLQADAHSFLSQILQKDPSKRPSCKDLNRHAWIANECHHLEKLDSPLLKLGSNGQGSVSFAKLRLQPPSPQVCVQWRSTRIPRMQGDAADGLDGDETSGAGDLETAAKTSEVESITFRNDIGNRALKMSSSERTPSTPTTAADDDLCSPSGHSTFPFGEPEEQEIGEDAHWARTVDLQSTDNVGKAENRHVEQRKELLVLGLSSAHVEL
jgi:serine/threonine protein kinase